MIYSPQTKRLNCGPRTRQCGGRCLPRGLFCHGNVDSTVKAIENSIKDKPVEHAYIIDAKTGEVHGYGVGDRTSVSLSPSSIPLIKGNIITHNHPPQTYDWDSESYKGLSLSHQDVLMAASYKAREIRAVTNSYRHSMRPKADWPDALSLEKSYKKHYSDTLNDLRWQMVLGTITEDKANAALWHEVNKKVSKEMNLDYSRTTLGGLRADARKCTPDEENNPSTVKSDAADPIATTKAKRQLSQVVFRVLSRSYKEPIERFVSFNTPNSSSLTGSFLSKGRLISFSIDLDKSRVSTWITKDGRRDDRLDARRSFTRKCGSGFSCGNTCISKKKKCLLNLANVASQGEVRQMKQIATFLKQEETPEKDISFREYRKIASEKGVYRYSRMSKSQLEEAIKAVDSPAEQRKRLQESLRKKQYAENFVSGNAVYSYAKDWKTAKKIMTMAGSTGAVSLAAAALYFYGRTGEEVNKIEAGYRAAYPSMAKLADSRAQGFEGNPNLIEDDKDAIMFLVPGYKNESSTSTEMKNALNSTNKNSPQASFLRDNHQIIEFYPTNQRDIVPPEQFSDADKERYTAAYKKFLLDNSVNGFFENRGLVRGIAGEFIGQRDRTPRNNDAIELAAQIYAYGTATEDEDYSGLSRDELNTKYKGFVGNDPPATLEDEDLVATLNAIRDKRGNGNTKKLINIFGHGAGGGTAREAIEILARMKEGNTDAILSRINLITLSSPRVLNVTSDALSSKIRFQVNYTCPSDPFYRAPDPFRVSIPTVKNREIRSFFEDPEFIRLSAENFGMTSTKKFKEQTDKQVRDLANSVEQALVLKELKAAKAKATLPTTDSIYREAFRRRIAVR